MRKVTVFTGSRADYGLLHYLMRDIQDSNELHLQLVVSGAHLSPEYGSTYQQIEHDDFIIDEKVEMLISTNTSTGVAKSMGLGLALYADALIRLAPDIVVVLGDRYEALAFAQAAVLLNIPICHLHGGELSEGAYDDAFRHAITKMSTFHCVGNEQYRKRVIQLGEHPSRVFNYGAIGLEYLRRTVLLDKTELYSELSLNPTRPYFVLTYHPVTAANEDPVSSIHVILNALNQFPEYQCVITYPNADDGGHAIIEVLKKYAEDRPDDVFLYKSLRQFRYFSAVKHCAAVIGNSSSGTSEIPYFKLGSVNVGQRQSGRMAPASVVHSDVSEAALVNAIRKVISKKFRDDIKNIPPMFGDGNTSKKIISLLSQCDLSTQKTFYDIEVADV